jgi:hypothetical protein
VHWWNTCTAGSCAQRFFFERYIALVRRFGPVQAGPSKFKPMQWRHLTITVPKKNAGCADQHLYITWIFLGYPTDFLGVSFQCSLAQRLQTVLHNYFEKYHTWASLECHLGNMCVLSVSPQEYININCKLSEAIVASKVDLDQWCLTVSAILCYIVVACMLKSFMLYTNE